MKCKRMLLGALAAIMMAGPTLAQQEAYAPRPQMPVRPFPYKEIEVVYENASQPGVRLADTLTVPRGKGPFPVVLLITGSGQQDRDESLLGHKRISPRPADESQ